jgi:hypothetical protein
MTLHLVMNGIQLLMMGASLHAYRHTYGVGEITKVSQIYVPPPNSRPKDCATMPEGSPALGVMTRVEIGAGYPDARLALCNCQGS